MSFADSQPVPLDSADGLDPYVAFRVNSQRDIIALMRELNSSGTPIQLSAHNGAHIDTVIWSVDIGASRLAMHAEPDHPQMQALVEANEVTAVAYLEAVKLQFDLEELLLVRGAQASALQATLPRHVYRFQRRQAYRVRPQERAAPTIALRHPSMPDMQVSLRVLDLSMGGCAVLLPSDVPELRPGSVLHGVRLQLDTHTRLAASLLVHHVTCMHSQRLGVRLGCELLHLDAEALRSLQRYIDTTQKRHRLLSLN